MESTPKRFEDREAAEAWLRSTFETWMGSLTDAERQALRAYKLFDGEPLNEILRRDADPSDEQVEMVRQLDSALARFRLPESIIVYRGTASTDLRLGPVGGEIVNYAYTSTSLRRVVAEDFVHSSRPDEREISEILIPGGALIASYAGAPDLVHALGEQEILLPRASRFRIIGQGPTIEMEMVL